MTPAAARPTVEVLIVSYNTKAMLHDCLESVFLYPAGSANVSVAVWDNGSTDGSPTMIRQEFPEVRLVTSPVNVGFGRANNRLAASSQADFLLLCNSDTLWLEDVVTPLVERLNCSPRAIAVGPRLQMADGDRQASFARFPRLWHEIVLLAESELGPRTRPIADWLLGRADSTMPREVEVLWATCWLLRRSDVMTHGLFDEAFTIYDEDFDYCARMRSLDRSFIYEPRASLVHFGGASARPAERSAMMRHSRGLLYRRHRGAATAFGYRTLIAILSLVAKFRPVRESKPIVSR